MGSNGVRDFVSRQKLTSLNACQYLHTPRLWIDHHDMNSEKGGMSD